MGLDTCYDNISEVLSLLQKYKYKMIAHNGDNYTNKLYKMIYTYKHYIWRSTTAVKTLVQECCEKSVLFFFLIISFIYIYIYIRLKIKPNSVRIRF
jgi:hypothetical protein